MTVLTVATCQFPVAVGIGANLHRVKRQMVTASRRGARGAHFPEGALSAYAGTDFIISRDGRIAALYLFFDGPGDATASKQVFNPPILGKERP